MLQYCWKRLHLKVISAFLALTGGGGMCQTMDAPPTWTSRKDAVEKPEFIDTWLCGRRWGWEEMSWLIILFLSKIWLPSACLVSVNVCACVCACVCVCVCVCVWLLSFPHLYTRTHSYKPATQPVMLAWWGASIVWTVVVATSMRMTCVWHVAHLPGCPTATLTVVSHFVSKFVSKFVYTRMFSVQVLYHTVVAYPITHRCWVP